MLLQRAGRRVRDHDREHTSSPVTSRCLSSTARGTCRNVRRRREVGELSAAGHGRRHRHAPGTSPWTRREPLNPHSRDDGEAATHSFVVRIWLAEPADRHRCGRWREHVTHVTSGTRVHVADLDDIRSVISPTIGAMEVRSDVRCRLRRWSRRLVARQRRG